MYKRITLWPALTLNPYNSLPHAGGRVIGYLFGQCTSASHSGQLQPLNLCSFPHAGGREIGYLFGQYKRITALHTGALTGKG